MTTDPRAVILALAEHEEAMSALYSAYAVEFPDVASLWTSLARDEHGHGALLRSLAEKSDDLTAFVENRAYDIADVEADTARLPTSWHTSRRLPASPCWRRSTSRCSWRTA